MRPLYDAQDFIGGLGARVHDLNRRPPGIAKHPKQLLGALRPGNGNEFRLGRVSFDNAPVGIVQVISLPFDAKAFQPFDAGEAFSGFAKVSFALNRG